MTKATIRTNYGNVTIQLHDDRCPETVSHFLALCNDGFYDGVIFHRVIPGFIIQAGGYQTGMAKIIATDSVVNEAKSAASNTRGTVAMARLQQPDSATTQFFINLADNSSLDYKGDQNAGYCVFGEVVEGMETVDAIAAVETGRRGMHLDVPVSEVVIEGVDVA
ncbi:peptidylprolyl isomerase [Escherichia coli]|uniref:peptidylprolyl isomerase n=1 Tax=Escherichia coli TaxID=562 RepID=UPI000BE2E492|nr:peptidylprolyl isomerase [Escherichia coli]